MGKWDVSESQSNFVYLPFSHAAFLRNKMIQNVAQLFKEFVCQIYPKLEVEEIIIPFQKFVSFKFSAKKTHINDYILTNAFKNALLNYYNHNGINLDGIIYSSAMTNCAAINVALTANFADKFLKLDKVVMMSCDGIEKQRNFDDLTGIVNVTDNGEFKVLLK